jgi:hypothetical protein
MRKVMRVTVWREKPGIALEAYPYLPTSDGMARREDERAPL